MQRMPLTQACPLHRITPSHRLAYRNRFCVSPIQSKMKFLNSPDYERFARLFEALDLAGLPRIEIVQAGALAKRASGNGEIKRLGIFSGSFNPITVAHAAMAEQAVAQFQLDELLLLLAKANVDKGVFGLPLAARLVTLKRYAESRPGFSVGASSHGRYIDKITALSALYPPQTEFHFIVGYDTLIRIFDAKYYTDFDAELRELFAACRFIVANRADADVEAIVAFMAQPATRPYAPFVSSLVLPDAYADVSSTEIRLRLEQGETITHLVPPVIAEFLE